MIPETPQAGMVLHYSFLWQHEVERGQAESVKDRPVGDIVLLADGEETVVAPITTRPPDSGSPAIEIPLRVRVGLDASQYGSASPPSTDLSGLALTFAPFRAAIPPPPFTASSRKNF